MNNWMYDRGVQNLSNEPKMKDVIEYVVTYTKSTKGEYDVYKNTKTEILTAQEISHLVHTGTVVITLMKKLEWEE